MHPDSEDLKQDSQPISLFPFHSFRYSDFRFLWLVNFFSSAARNLQQISLGWLAFDLTGRPVLLASVMLAYQLPFLTVAPLIGVLVDRMDRRKLLLWSQTTMALIAVGLAVDIGTGFVRPWHLFVFAFLSGVENTIIHIVRQALVPRVVPPYALLNAISLTGSAFNLTRIFAPLIAGFLIVNIGVTGSFTLQAGLLCVVALSALSMRVGREEIETVSGSRLVILGQLAYGFQYIWGSVGLRTIMAVNFLTMFLGLSIVDLLPAWADDVLRLEADGLSVLYSATGIGALIGMLILASLSGTIRRQGRLLIGLAILMAFSLIVFSIVNTLWIALLTLGVMGALHTMFFAVTSSLVQKQVPHGLQGRVMSIYNMGHIFMALGTLTMARISEIADLPLAVAFMGACLLLLSLLMAIMPTIRRS